MNKKKVAEIKEAVREVIGEWLAEHGDKRRACPSLIPCEACMWHREWRYENRDTGQVEMRKECAIEFLITKLAQLIFSVDGNQVAANEARNAVWSMAAGLAAHGMQAPLRALQSKAGERIVASIQADERPQLDVIDAEVEDAAGN